MSAVFLKLLNLSITAGWMIAAVIIVRFFLKKAPKWISCVLWALAAIRLICPFSMESALSLVPSSKTIPDNIGMMNQPEIDSGIPVINKVVNPALAGSFTPEPSASANPLQIVLTVCTAVWLAGMAAMLCYALISFIRLKKNVGASISVGKNILVCDEVKSPFILGIFRPLIYVPSSMNGATLDSVIAHETAHIRRHDHWWKPLGYLLLSVYWFNPLCWAAYVLLCRDIEMACDEKVIRNMEKDSVAAYSQALLDGCFPRRRIAVCPLAFGEVGVKERVKSVLNYRKPAFWVVIASVLACVCVGICFMTNPEDNEVVITDGSGKYGVMEFTGTESDSFLKDICNASPGDLLEDHVRFANQSEKADYINVCFRLLPENWAYRENLYDDNDVRFTKTGCFNMFAEETELDDTLKKCTLTVSDEKSGDKLYSGPADGMIRLSRIEPENSAGLGFQLQIPADLSAEETDELHHACAELPVFLLNEHPGVKVEGVDTLDPSGNKVYHVGDGVGVAFICQNTGNVDLLAKFTYYHDDDVIGESGHNVLVRPGHLLQDGMSGGTGSDPSTRIGISDLTEGYHELSMSIVYHADNPDITDEFEETVKVIFHVEEDKE